MSRLSLIQRPNLFWLCDRLFIDNYAGSEENLTAIIAFLKNMSTVERPLAVKTPTISGSFWCLRVMKFIDICHVIGAAPRRYLPGNKLKLHLIAYLPH